jgi:hypothetical protein
VSLTEDCGCDDALVASAAPIAPPAEWFDQPEPDHAMPLTVEPDGRVHGHLAPWEGCHSGLVNGTARSCMRPPRSMTDYRMFHLGELELDDGSAIPVGKIIVQGDHAPTRRGVSLQAATSHYDKTGSVAAFVRARNGKHGIFLSGATKSDITPEQLRDLRANLPSGDWRNLNHNLELIGALAVPVPGYGIPAIVATAGGEIEALIMGFTDETEVAMSEHDPQYVLEKRMIRDQLEDPFGDGLTAAVFSAEQRRSLAKTGAAMPDGSFPIRNCSDWQNARQAVGRAAPSKRAAVRAHIAKRGRALGCGDSD